MKQVGNEIVQGQDEERIGSFTKALEEDEDEDGDERVVYRITPFKEPRQTDKATTRGTRLRTEGFDPAKPVDSQVYSIEGRSIDMA